MLQWRFLVSFALIFKSSAFNRICDGTDECKQTTIGCPANEPCSITCSGSNACNKAVINGTLASTLDIDCIGGTTSNACTWIEIYCPPKDGTTKKCTITADDALHDQFKLYAINSWHDINIIYSGTWFLSTLGWGSMYCTQDYTSSCFIKNNEWTCNNGADLCNNPPTLPPATSSTTQPTTLSPTTLAPTTLYPTTISPTTRAPTTIAPSTTIPTTFIPTTLFPTTISPTTSVPTTASPSSSSPTSLYPTTSIPTTNVPTSLVTKVSSTSSTTSSTLHDGGVVESTISMYSTASIDKLLHDTDDDYFWILYVVLGIVICCVLISIAFWKKRKSNKADTNKHEMDTAVNVGVSVFDSSPQSIVSTSQMSVIELGTTIGMETGTSSGGGILMDEGNNDDEGIYTVPSKQYITPGSISQNVTPMGNENEESGDGDIETLYKQENDQDVHVTAGGTDNGICNDTPNGAYVEEDDDIYSKPSIVSQTSGYKD